ncbi:nSTAND1 domain-containing NTPase [Leptolyngbya ohadii]|uniref:nSTAND1 domain-containing NTPase n=1 Tax=Leptolyngbya ohadii TaxID=1962290 RepID=UPI000B59C1A5|nr:hypothetical protein [Leptolyngbya ohadii]
MADQDDLLDRLQQLNESQIEELIYRLQVNRAHLSAGSASLNQRSIELIRYLEPQIDGLKRLRSYLEEMLVPADFDDPALLPACPYQGLFAFQEEDAAYFFGRDAFIQDWVQKDGSVRQGIVRLVETKPLVAVVGASGSGKSSLVFAGLVPRLRRSGNWLIESMRPEKQPFFRLAVALLRQLEPELSRIDRTNKANTLAENIQKYGIANYVSEILQGHSGQKLLLIVDQFEELYTQCAVAERDRFIEVLLEGMNRAIGLRMVLTLRADFCGQAYAYRPLADALQGADLKLGPMNREELQEAIERPAQLMQVNFEEGLTDWLLDDVGQEAGNLPLLEFALTELWKMQRQKKLLYQAYTRLGGVARALANHADTVYARLSPEDQKRSQRIFVQLVRPGDGTEDTRRVASRAEVGTENWDLVTRLAGEDARLVVTGRNQETVEIVHEALLREWRYLRNWMEQDRTFRVWQEGLRFARRQWQQSGQDETALLDGFLLSEAEAWQSKRPEDLSPEDESFIQKSKEVHVERELEKLRMQLELETERKQREAAEQANRILAKAQTKAKQIVRFGFVVMGLSIGLGILFIAVFPWSAIFLNNRGYEKLQAKDHHGALRDFNLAVMLKPDYVMAWYNKGLTYEELGEPSLAAANYKAAVAEKYPPAYNNLGRLEIIHTRNFNRAVELLEEGLRLDPDDETKYSLLKNLGWAKWKLADYAAAKQNLLTAIAVNDRRASAYCLLAQVQEEEQTKSDARQNWEKCLSLGNPDYFDERGWMEMARIRLEPKLNQ